MEYRLVTRKEADQISPQAAWFNTSIIDADRLLADIISAMKRTKLTNRPQAITMLLSDGIAARVHMTVLNDAIVFYPASYDSKDTLENHYAR